MRRKKKPVTLNPIRPNIGIERAYRLKLDFLIHLMHHDVVRELLQTYKVNPPELAADASPAVDARLVMRRLTRKWVRRFEEAAPELAEYFSLKVQDRSDRALAAILQKASFSVRFRMTRAMNDVLQATIGENVSLIKSIGSDHLAEVEGLVMRSVQRGRDLASLNRDLAARYMITRRRAALISRDQNNKATAAITAARHVELGIEEALWLHSGAGKKPRPSHVAFHGKRYNIREGALIDGVRTWPGYEINCRCQAKPILPGLK